MKKLLLIFTILLLFIIPVYALNMDLLTKIENNLYGFEYSKDNVQKRVSRLEKTVYGKSLNGNVDNRLKKLSDDIAGDVIGLEITPCKDTFLAEDEQADNTVNYPIVDEIEMKLFNQTYKNRDFHTRIVTIEKKLFGKIYDVDDYSKRMDRIKSKIMPETVATRENYDYEESMRFSDNSINSDDLSGTNFSRFQMPFGQRKYTRPYTNYGDFNSADYDYNSLNRDNLNDNLSQMEYDMFGTEFSNEDVQTRIKRLNSVNKAKKSSHKYDSQKFSQHMSTAMEIGAMILMILAMVL